MPNKISDQIVAFENRRASADARMTALLEKSTEDSRVLDDTEAQEYESLETDIKEIDNHIARLRRQEARQLERATAVKADGIHDPGTAAGVRGSRPLIQVKANVPPGTAMVRYIGALVACDNNRLEAAEYAKQYWHDSTPEVELLLRHGRGIVYKTGVDAGDTTTSGWASQLVPAARQMQDEFLDLLRPATILGRIPGLRNVPFNVSVPVQTGGGTYGWVGEAAGKPVTSLQFSSVTLRWAKAAGIIVITKELAMFSSPSAEALVRADMLAGVARFLDVQFIDPNVAAVTNVSPASITNGITATPSTGTTAAKFRTDMQTLINKFNTNNQNLSNLVLLMSATVATNLGMLVNSLGQPEFPAITRDGGSVFGIPVIVSQNAGTNIIAMNPNDILVAQDGGIQIDVSDQASVEMETTPAVGEQSPLTSVSNIKSFWQNNLVGLRVERFITWIRGRTSAVEYISNASYSG